MLEVAPMTTPNPMSHTWVPKSETPDPEEPASAKRAVRREARSAQTNPDEEAMRILTSLADRAAVARSVTRIAGRMLAVSALRATAQVRAVARAAASAAAHVASRQTDRDEGACSK